MMQNIIQVFLSFFIDFVKIWLVMWGIMHIPVTKNKWAYILTIIMNSIFLIITGLFSYDSEYVSYLFILLDMFTICILFRSKMIKKLATGLLVYLLILFLDFCVLGVISLLIDSNAMEIISNNSLSNMVSSVNVILFSIITVICKSTKKQLIFLGLSLRIYTLLFTGIVTSIFIVTLLMFTSLPGVAERARRVMLIVTIVICITYTIACQMLVILTESRDRFKTLSQINQNVIESQQRYYMLVQEKQQEIRSIRHEIKNHYSCINGLLKASKLQELELYMNQLLEQAETLDILFETGNDIVDAILNDAQSRYQKQGICIRLEGGFPKELHVASTDLCVIFANAVSNAIEAIEKMKKNNTMYYVDISIRSIKDDLYIDIENPIQYKVEILKGKPTTTKKDKAKHGFGTNNMIQRVKKYDGEIEFISKNHKFYVSIHMKNS